jgi:hypothetical protein
MGAPTSLGAPLPDGPSKHSELPQERELSCFPGDEDAAHERMADRAANALNCIPLYVCGPPNAVDSVESSNTFDLKEAIDSIDAVEPANTADPATAVDSVESTETVERAETVDPVLQYSPAVTAGSSPRSTHLSPTNSAGLPVEPNRKPRSPGDFIHGADSTANGNTAVTTVSKIPDAHGMQPSGQLSCYSRQASQPTFASVVVSGARPPAPSSLIKISAVEKLLWNGLPPVGVKVHSVWCMVHGVWCIVYGTWCMVYSAWYQCMVVRGVLCMVYGVWYQ